MIYHNVTKKYTHLQQSMAKSRQLVILYDGVIRIIYQAIDAIKNKNIQERYNLLAKAGAVIHGLQISLDFKEGGEIATILDNYYMSIYARIINVNSNNNCQILENVILELSLMRDAWHEVDQNLYKEKSPIFDDTTKTISQNYSA